MPVRDEEAGDPVPLERSEVGVHDVDAEPPIVEADPAVDEEHLAPLLDREAVHPDFAEAAQRKEAHGGVRPSEARRGGEPRAKAKA